MTPRSRLAKDRADKLDYIFDSIGSGMVAARVKYAGPLQSIKSVRMCMASLEEAVLARREHTPTKATKDRIAAAIATAMSKLIELSVREDTRVGERIADKA